MKIVNNVKEMSKELEIGEIIRGVHSGDYYMIIPKGFSEIQAFNLKKLNVTSLSGMAYKHTGIKKENVTITFDKE